MPFRSAWGSHTLAAGVGQMTVAEQPAHAQILDALSLQLLTHLSHPVGLVNFCKLAGIGEQEGTVQKPRSAT